VAGAATYPGMSSELPEFRIPRLSTPGLFPGSAGARVASEARATAIAPGPERDRLCAQHAATFPGFLEYERQTTRTIPVVLLERI
jgi:hypothetical protein